MKSHKDLDVWKSGMELATDVYSLTRSYPKDELYGMVSQMRRCVVSIPSNIAEGANRNGTKEFIQFLYVATGSANELDTQIELSKATGMADEAHLSRIQQSTNRVIQMLRGLIRSLNAQQS